MVSLGPNDVGSRITVRVRVGPADQPIYIDAVGELMAYDDTGIVVRRRGGRQLSVAHADVLAGHVVPPRSDAAGRVSDADVEAIAARGWRGRETRPIGGWLLRAAGGWTGRANSVLALGDPDVPLDEALARVIEWYAERDLAARFQLPLPLRAELDEALAARGWTAYNPTLFLTSDLGPVRRALPPAEGVQFATTPSDEWLAAYHYRGGSLPAIARDVMVDADQPGFASIVDDGAVVAIGRAVVDERWCGFTALEVVESHRRRGLARLVLRGLLDWATGLGARHIYLQVAEDNVAAIELYRQLGFSVHHRYHYRLQP
ncbi:MAG: N-acetylglutamate synthase [Frankiales bacterium]|jgi:GNAT superfamily N-acetyltransferase|nr:N-acetylglutamate synthase [Frankiales bacterium]